MKIAALCLSLCLLAGCATPAVKVQGDNYCRLSKRITWSKNDTSPTVDQIRRSNARHHRVCG